MKRRAFLLGAGLAAAKAYAGDTGVTKIVMAARPRAQLFTHPPLDDNDLAVNFEPFRRPAPKTVLLGADGEHTLKELTGKVRLVVLWAEWCSACLLALPDLFKLQQRYGGPKFEILAVLTSSGKRLDVAGANAVLAKYGAGGLPNWIEPGGGKTLLNSLAVNNGFGSLPCDLLVDAHGRIRGRSFGTGLAVDVPPLSPGDIANGGLTASGRVKLERAEAAAKSNPQRSAWSSLDADAFIKALVGGALS